MNKLYNPKYFLLVILCIVSTLKLKAQASACPAVNAGSDVTICEGTCANLNAVVQGTIATSSYIVSSIPYNPYAYNVGTAVSVGVDDIWSGIINLPFCFQFFGNSYSRVIIGSNGVVSFNTANANLGSGYVICGALPTNCGSTPLNAILGPWHDIDPSWGGSVRYQIYGTAPCRELVVAWNNVPMFSSACNATSSLNASHQIVLHENTNIIDIYIRNKQVCASWNGGDAIEGIQNAAGTVAYTVPGRNFPTNWTASNDGYRFSPSGAPQYTIEWRDPSGTVVGNNTGVSVCPTTTTTYTAVVTNTTCSTPIIVNDAVTVIVNPKPIVTVNSPNICTGNSANLSANGASTYTWTGGLPPNQNVTTPVLNSSTSYTVTGTAANGCKNTAVSNVTVNPLPTVAVNSPGICIGTSATLTATGASTYTWTGGLPNGSPVTTPILNANASYTVTGTDAIGCKNTAVSNVTVTPKPTIAVNSPTVCAGTSATLTATGGATYTWTGGLPAGSTATTPILNSSTSYTVTGADANGCTNTAVATITVIPAPNVGVNSPAICTGNSTTLTATGANTYTWTGGLPNGATVTTPVLSSTTSYTVTGTGPNGCTKTAVSTVTVNPLPVVNVNSPSICTGFSANLNATGATTYTWTGGLPNGANPTTPILTSNTSYTVTGTDGNGCQNTAVSNINVNPSPIVGVNSPTICAGQTASLAATGASTYTWTGGLPAGSNPTTPVLNTTTSYTVTGTDVNGCKNTSIATVTVNPKPIVAVNSPTICSGFTAGLNATGANTYTWTGGLPNGTNVTTPVLTSNTSYTVTGTDGNGCQNTAVSTVRVNPLPTVNVNSPSVCTGFSAGLNATGASTYTWTGGLPNGTNVTTPILTSNTSYTVTGTDGNGCQNTAISNITVNPSPVVGVNSPTICAGQTASLSATGANTYTWTGGLPNGANPTTPVLNTTTSYTVTGTDANGCKNTAISSVTVNPKPIIGVNSPTICAGFTANLNATGATSYTWTGGLPNGSNPTTPVLNTTTSYTVTGTDGNGCQNTALSTITVNPLPIVGVNSPTICFGFSTNLTATGANTYTWTGGLPGSANVTTPVLTSSTSYTVTGTDGNGCNNTAISNITVNPSPTVNVTSPIICSGQTASISANGANTYTWTSGLPNGANPTTPVLTSNTSYTVIGSDANGCKDTALSNVTVNPLPVVGVNSPTICAGFSANLNATGANTYTWTAGLPNGSAVTTPILNSTTSYTVTGTDGNGCQNTALSTITVNPLPLVGVNSPTVCFGFSTNLTATGANTYTWSGGLPNGSNVTTPVLTSNTSYTVTGSDGNGCQNTAISNITVTPSPIINVSSPVICYGQTASISATGASTYTWSGGLPNGANPTTPVLTSNTSYTVIGADANGCKDTAISNVTVNPLPVVNVNSPTICAGQTANLNATGANTYTWTGGLPNASAVTTPVLNNSTSYTVTGTDGNGCQNTAVSSIIVNPLPIIGVNSPTICSGYSTNLNATGANTYAWTGGLPNGANVSTPILTSSTSYTVTGTDGNGCQNTAISNITVTPSPIVNVTSPIICYGQTASISASGASTYTWSGGLPDGSNQTTPVLTSNTSYTVIGTDVNGCKDTAISNITVNPLPTVGVNSPTICAGQTANLNATGANTYTWTGGLPGGSNVNTPVLNVSTSYTVTGTDVNGCQNTSVSNITVNPKPIVTVNSPTICQNESTTLIAGGANTYTWTNGLPNGATVNTPILNTTTVYTVTGTDGNLCTNIARSVVTVNLVKTTALNATLCQGETVTIGSQTFSSTGNYTVGLTTSLGCDSTVTLDLVVNPVKTTNLRQTICQGQSISIGGQAFPTTGQYTVNLQTSNGCDSTVNLDLTVKPNLLVEVDLIESQNDICYGTPVTFTATPSNGGTTPVYQWYLNNTPVGTNSSSYTNPLLDPEDVVWVQMVSSEMCVQNTPAFSPQIPMKVNRLDYIKPVIEYCSGNAHTLDLGVQNNAPYTIVWTNGNYIHTSVNEDEMEVSNTTSGHVDFVIQFGNNCVKRDSVNINVNPLPTATLSVSEDTVRYGDTVQLQGTIADPTNQFIWTPAVSDPLILNPTATVFEPTKYFLEVTDSKGCRVSRSVFVQLVDECNSNYIFTPNAFTPNNDGLNDCFGPVDVSVNSDYHLVVFDRWGERLFESYDMNECWDGRYKGVDALMDTYPFVITYRCYNGMFIEKHDILTLIR